jgi:hypothetical protein
MKTFRLKALVRATPTCESYEDEASVRRYEQEVRVHRAYTEEYRVAPLGDGIEGTYRVESATGASYLVDIVDGSHEADACSCPDFLTNDLGTCKHLEAVRRFFEASRKLARAYAQLPRQPSIPTLSVDPCGGLALMLRGTWTKALLARAQLAEKDGEVFPQGDKGLPPALRGVRVVHAAQAAWEQIRTTRALSQRRGRVQQALDQGRLGVDVLSRPLFPYQRDGVAHLVKAGRALLADDMGLGKTAQAIAACEVLCARGEADRVLIVTPASLKDQWAKEIERYAGARAVVVGGGHGARRAALSSDARYKIVNYELTWRELDGIRALDADILVLDEAQRAKNFRTKTAATLRAIPSRFLFVLTGTPVENRLDDLYALMQLVDPTRLQPLWRFNLRFHRQNEHGKITGYKNLSQLRETIAGVTLRRRKEEVLTQLPAVTYQTRHLPLTKEQAALEEEHRAVAAQLLARAERRSLTLEEQQRLMMNLVKARQACDAAELCDPGCPVKGSPKLDEMESLVSEIVEQGPHKILIFSEWVEMLKLAAQRLDARGVGYRMLHGGVPSDRRPALLEAFHDDPGIRVLLSSDAGGVGLNLQVATYIIHLDLPWNPARLDQRVARSHRLGQTRGVSVTFLCAETGIERGIEGTLSGKRAVRSAALDPSSEVEELDAPSFTLFLRQLQQVLDDLSSGADLEPESIDEEGPAEPGPSGEPAPPLDADSIWKQQPADGPPGLPAPAPGEAGVPALPPPPPADAGALAALPSSTSASAPAAPQGEVPPVPSAPSVPPLTAHSPGAAASEVPGERAHSVASGSTSVHSAQNRLRLARVVLDAGFHGDALRAAYDALASAIASLLDAPLGLPPDAPRASLHAALVAALYRELLPSGRLPPAAHAALARVHDLSALEAHGVAVDADLARSGVDEASSWVERLEQRPAAAS